MCFCLAKLRKPHHVASRLRFTMRCKQKKSYYFITPKKGRISVPAEPHENTKFETTIDDHGIINIIIIINTKSKRQTRMGPPALLRSKEQRSWNTKAYHRRKCKSQPLQCYQPICAPYSLPLGKHRCGPSPAIAFCRYQGPESNHWCFPSTLMCPVLENACYE